MKEHPILFSGEMVRAILDGRKTMTRRVIKPQPVSIPEAKVAHANWIMQNRTCPYGQPGDRLWVRETWKPTRASCAIATGIDGPGTYVRYRADDSRRTVAHSMKCRGADREPWHPSIFMPRWASRITLEITEVRVERVQDITAADAEAEGFLSVSYRDAPKGSIGFPAQVAVARIAIGQFAKYWDSLNAKRGYGWAANPWVWVISFKRVG